MQSAKTGRPTIEKSFRNSGEASACSSKQRYSIERQLECRPYLVSTRFRFQHSCRAASQPSDICRRFRSNALGPFDLALSLSAAELLGASTLASSLVVLHRPPAPAIAKLLWNCGVRIQAHLFQNG